MQTPQEPSLLGGRYHLLEQIGLGGMAHVYHARDLQLLREVAIKVLREDWIEDATFRSNFLQEARAAANLSHPNIVTIFDFGHDNDRIYIVMEYVHGTDLKTLIRRKQHFKIDDAILVMSKICHGVGYAHRAGLVHCDLKPQNILITPDGGAKITDFGISRALAAVHPDERTDIVWGSPQYFSPEQARGEPPSPASDVYSLGVIFYEMLAGEPPFHASDSMALAEMHINTPAPSPRRRNPDVPADLDQIILKLLSKEPTARYRTADQLGSILTTLIQNHAVPGPANTSVRVQPPDEAHATSTMAMDLTPVTQVDWLSVGLGLAAFLALGGLLPLWLWACLLYPTCPINAG
jgi:serine/threonine protein kinase